MGDNLTKDLGFMSLCYHYVRPNKDNDKFEKLLGSNFKQFNEHLDMLKKLNFNFISLDVIDKYYNNNNYYMTDKNYGILLTFDDGLSDHYDVAKILYERNIKATFFIPTCIIADELPANPIIIHYFLSVYGIQKFIDIYKKALYYYEIDFDNYSLSFSKGNDPWEAIAKIKNIFKYQLNYSDSRKVLLYIYRNKLLKDFPNALEIMHLNKKQIKEMIEMGHSIGTHSNSHISIASTDMDSDLFHNEMIFPKLYLEENFNTKVKSISYPFGEKQDCLAEEQLLRKTDKYRLAFTVEPKINTKKTSSFQLGRYMPWSTDDAKELKSVISEIINKNKHKDD